jgi:hypothetical protein
LNWTPLRVAPHVLDATFVALRGCGRGCRECVVYWLGPADVDDLVVEVVHPRHNSGQWGYEIDDGWLTGFWLDLVARSMSARVQVHTHPGEASHSATDDNWALVHTAGFMSLVLPRFAMGPVSLMGAHLVERTEDGGWRRVGAATALAFD